MIRTRIEIENVEEVRRRGAEVGRLERPGDAGEAGAEGERQELGPDRVDAHHLGRRLVLADRAPGAPHARALQVPGDDDRDEQQEHAEVRRASCPERAPKMMSKNGMYGGSIGLIPCTPPVQFCVLEHDVDRAQVERERDARQVLEEQRHDLAEAEGHDRQVVAAQPERRRAEQRAERRDDDDRDDRDDPERQVDPGGTRRRRCREGQVDAERAEVGRGEERRACTRRSRRTRRSRGRAGPANPATMFRPMAMIAKIIMNVTTVSSGSGSGKTCRLKLGQDTRG